MKDPTDFRAYENRLEALHQSSIYISGGKTIEETQPLVDQNLSGERYREY